MLHHHQEAAAGQCTGDRGVGAKIDTTPREQQEPPQRTGRARAVGVVGVQFLLTQQTDLAKAGGQGPQACLPAQTLDAEPGWGHQPQLPVGVQPHQRFRQGGQQGGTLLALEPGFDAGADLDATAVVTQQGQQPLQGLLRRRVAAVAAHHAPALVGQQLSLAR